MKTAKQLLKKQYFLRLHRKIRNAIDNFGTPALAGANGMVISGAVPAEVCVASTAVAVALGVRAGVTAGSVVGSNIHYSGRGSEKPAGGETLQKDRNEKTSNKADINTLYHYTNEKGLNGILESNELRPSLKANNPKDARYGDGQYLSEQDEL